MKLTTLEVDVIPAVRTVLLAATDNRPVVTLVPSVRPVRFTQITRTGGVAPDHLRGEAQLSIDSWAADEPTAGSDARTVQAALLAARDSVVDGVVIYRVAVLGGPAYFRDPVSHAERYRQLLVVHTRGVAYP